MTARSDLIYLAALMAVLAGLSVYGRRLEEQVRRELAEIAELEAIPVIGE